MFSRQGLAHYLPGWLQTSILLISASWVPRITGVSYQCLAFILLWFLLLHFFKLKQWKGLIPRPFKLNLNLSCINFTHVYVWQQSKSAACKEYTLVSLSPTLCKLRNKRSWTSYLVSWDSVSLSAKWGWLHTTQSIVIRRNESILIKHLVQCLLHFKRPIKHSYFYYQPHPHPLTISH
jgi:hypothetical protein